MVLTSHFSKTTKDGPENQIFTRLNNLRLVVVEECGVCSVILLCFYHTDGVCKAFYIQVWVIHYFILTERYLLSVADLFPIAPPLIILWGLSLNGHSIAVGVLGGLLR